MQTNGKAAQFLGPPRTADYRPSLVTPLPYWQGRDIGWYSWFDVEWMRRDPQCQFGLRILRAPLATVTWEIAASSPEVAAWVDRTLKRIWTRYLNKVTAYLEYGSCGGETTWYYDRASDLIELNELLDLHVLDMQPLQQRRKQVGIRVKSSLGNMAPDDLFAPRYWWIANEPEFGAYHGRARLAGAWIPWQEKTARHGARDVRRTWYVKNVMDGGTLYVPPGTTEVDVGVYKSNMDYGRELMEKVLAGGVTVLPNVTDEKGKRLWERDPPKINGELAGIHTLMEELDIEIIVGMGIPPEVVQAADTGSGWSGRSVPFLVFLTSEDQLADTTVQAIDRNILRPGVAVNFGEDARYEIRLKSLVKQAEEEEAKKQGQAPGAKPGETAAQGREQKPGQPQTPQGTGQAPGRPQGPVRLSVQHAPPGGVSIGGQDFKGGEFIPGDVLAKATVEEKRIVEEGGKQKESEIADRIARRLRLANPRHVRPVNVVRHTSISERHVVELEKSLRKEGWVGRPVLAIKDGQEYQALTGSHRLEAARLADMEAPLVLVDWEEFQKTASDLGFDLETPEDTTQLEDDDRLAILKGMNDDLPAAIMTHENEDEPGLRMQLVEAPDSDEEEEETEGPERLSIQHAPAGGVSIGGQGFKGGEFIPGDVLEKATPQEKAKLKEVEKANSFEASPGVAGEHKNMREFYKAVNKAREQRPEHPDFHHPNLLRVEARLHELVSTAGHAPESLYFDQRTRFITVAGIDYDVTLTPQGENVVISSFTLHGPDPKDPSKFVVTPKTPAVEVEYRLRKALDLPVSAAEASQYKAADKAARGAARKAATARRAQRQRKKDEEP